MRSTAPFAVSAAPAEAGHDMGVGAYTEGSVPFVPITFASLVILDIRRKREQSVFVKYNPVADGRRLPRGCWLAFCIFAWIVTVARLLIMLCGK